jgi:biotin carboxyl carrier protein
MTEPSSLQLAPGEVAYDAPMSAVIVDVAAVGSQIPAGGQLALLEAMKIQHVVSATESVVVRRTLVTFEIDDVIDPADTRRLILTLRRRP